MEIACPSCGVKYRTEDYPGEFEINCVCGYAILIPDENAINAQSPEPNNMAAIPTSLESEDEAQAIVVRDLGQPVYQEEFTPSTEPFELTAPEDLPREMPYDPFELPPSPAPSSRSSAQKTSNAANSSGQVIVERAVMASVGQHLGLSYNIKCLDLSLDQIESLLAQCRQLIELRPWLAQEIERRGLSFNEAREPLEFANVPEILALEIYLSTFELGGRCEYAKVVLAT